LQRSNGCEERTINDNSAGRITRVEELAYELQISEVMTGDVEVVTPDLPMARVLELFRQARISGAPVVADDNLVGIVSIEDLIRSLTQGDLEAPVRDYMTTELITTRATDPVVEALKLFDRTQVGRLPVLDQNGKLTGIITKGDINHGLLKELQQDYQAEEIKRYRASHLFEDIASDRTSLILRYTIEPRNFTQGGMASSSIKRVLLRLGANPQIARRCGIAIYEAEMNLVIHATNGGVIQAEIEPHLISMEVIDDGPGIEDTELAMKPGYSTASEEVREMGFGAGMGLANIQRCVDEMSIKSAPNNGTRLEMKIFLQTDHQLEEERLRNDTPRDY
jgi:CBS domain-containing protein/anti-sigma regulatory factor (Ser/Thr protein kinase)